MYWTGGEDKNPEAINITKTNKIFHSWKECNYNQKLYDRETGKDAPYNYDNIQKIFCLVYFEIKL